MNEIFNKIGNFLEKIFGVEDYECSKCGAMVYDTGPGIVHKCEIEDVVSKAIKEHDQKKGIIK